MKLIKRRCQICNKSFALLCYHIVRHHNILLTTYVRKYIKKVYRGGRKCYVCGCLNEVGFDRNNNHWYRTKCSNLECLSIINRYAKFQAVYGEKAEAKYNLMAKKLSISNVGNNKLEGFIERHGKIKGTKKYKNWKKKLSESRKGKSTKKYYISKYGKIKGEKKWKEYLKKIDMTLKGFIRRHGKIEGNKRYKIFVSRSRQTKNSFIKRYGEEEGKKLWEEHIQIKKDTSYWGLQYWIDKGYSRKEAQRKQENIQRHDESFFIKKHGKRKGKNLYVDYCARKTRKLATRPSIVSQKFFKQVNSKLKDISKSKIYFGKKEYRIQTIKGNKFNVDFALPYYKILIEFYGDMWHMNPELYYATAKRFDGVVAKRIWNNDKWRIELLRKSGWYTLIVWESEYQKEETVNKVINFIKNRIKRRKNAKNKS